MGQCGELVFLHQEWKRRSVDSGSPGRKRGWMIPAQLRTSQGRTRQSGGGGAALPGCVPRDTSASLVLPRLLRHLQMAAMLLTQSSR